MCYLQVEVVYSLLSMLGTHDKDDMSQTLLAMSNSQDSCVAMRQSGAVTVASFAHFFYDVSMEKISILRVSESC